nr:hypothetical protein [Tissierella sp.]
MKIQNNIPVIKSQDKEISQKKDLAAKEKEISTPAAVYEKSKPTDKGHVYDKPSIDRLKMESERTTSHLRSMVENLLKSQGKSFDASNPHAMVSIDQATRDEAASLIGEDGPLGIEKMSDSIVDFAKALSGGDKGKLDTLIKAIDKGFKEAERILGGLPDISKKTYDRIMEKLDIWKNEEQ